MFEASLNAAEDPEDPADRDRKRTVNFDSVSRGKLSGEVYWGEKSDDTPVGTVHLFTALAPVVLNL